MASRVVSVMGMFAGRPVWPRLFWTGAEEPSSSSLAGADIGPLRQSRLQAAIDRGEQGAWPERLLQARHRAELGRHLQEIRLRIGVRRGRTAGDHDDRNGRP